MDDHPSTLHILDQAGIQLKPPKKRTPKAATTRQLLGGSAAVSRWVESNCGISGDRFRISTEKGDVKQPKLPQDWWFMQQEVGWMRIMEECQAVWIPNHHLSKKKHFSGGLPPRNQPGFINAGLTLHGLGKNQPRCSLNQEVWIYSICEGEAAEKEGKNQSFKRNFDLDP